MSWWWGISAMWGGRADWSSAIRGSFLITPDALDGKGGYIKKMPGYALQKEFWVSDKARDKHAEIYKMIVEATKWDKSKWKLLDTRAAFIARFNRLKETNRATSVIALMGKKDSKASWPGRFTPGSALPRRTQPQHLLLLVDCVCISRERADGVCARPPAPRSSAEAGLPPKARKLTLSSAWPLINKAVPDRCRAYLRPHAPVPGSNAQMWLSGWGEQ